MLGAWLLVLLSPGCATCAKTSHRPFNFQTDTFAYANELVWEYRLEGKKVVTRKREPPPTYTHRCFVMVRAARQFFNHAQFDPSLPKTTDYAPVVRAILARSPRNESSEADRIVIPGYSNLRALSREQAPVLQAECGGPWQSYFQRGHWRMIFPLTRRHQQSTAEKLLAELEQQRSPPVVHIVRFPSLAINHALLLCGAESSEEEIRFQAYDPNYPEAATTLAFRRKERRFFLPANDYFPRGGRVDVYPIFTGVLY